MPNSQLLSRLQQSMPGQTQQYNPAAQARQGAMMPGMQRPAQAGPPTGMYGDMIVGNMQNQVQQQRMAQRDAMAPAKMMAQQQAAQFGWKDNLPPGQSRDAQGYIVGEGAHNQPGRPTAGSFADLSMRGDTAGMQQYEQNAMGQRDAEMARRKANGEMMYSNMPVGPNGMRQGNPIQDAGHARLMAERQNAFRSPFLSRLQ